MAEPGDQVAAGAGGRDRLRASHGDREQVLGTLKAAFVAGMLAKDEFDLRVSQVLASRTHAELAAVTADLPTGLAAAASEPARAGGGQPLLRPGQIVTGATVLYAVWCVYAVFFPHGGDGPEKPALIFGGGLVYLCVLAIAAAVAAENRQDKRTGGQLPRGQAPPVDGPVSRRLPPASPGGQLPPADPGHRHTESARRRRPRPSLPARGPCTGDSLAAGTAPAGG